MSALVLAAARGWLGTPYRHQGSTRGAGCDCLGLLRGVWREVYGQEPQVPPPYSPDWDEIAARDVLRRAAERHLEPRVGRDVEVGDVLLFRMRRGAVAKHLGILSELGDAPRFIHAYSGHGVVENSLSEPWVRRIDGVFGWPGTDLKT